MLKPAKQNTSMKIIQVGDSKSVVLCIRKDHRWYKIGKENNQNKKIRIIIDSKNSSNVKSKKKKCETQSFTVMVIISNEFPFSSDFENAR